MLYFDHNATTPVSEEALRVYIEESRENWRNPSSPTRKAARVRNRLEAFRERLAVLMDCDPNRLLFNSGATEGNNAVLRKYSLRGNIGISPFEHSSVYKAASFFSSNLVECSTDKNASLIDLASLIESKNLSVLAIQAANNETGIVQDWEKIQSMCRSNGVRYLCDAAQWIGKMPLAGLSSCDYVSATAHKFGGPKGVGFLLVADPMDRLEFIHGGAQESDNRAGTENLPGIASMVMALEEQLQELESKSSKLIKDREDFENKLLELIPGTLLLGKKNQRIPNTSFFIMPEFASMKWIRRMEKYGVEISSSSACSSQHSNVSKVAKALGYSDIEAGRTIRISSAMDETQENWDELLHCFKKSWNDLRNENQNSMLIKI